MTVLLVSLCVLSCFAYVGMTSVRNGSVLPTPTQCNPNPIPVDLPFSLIGISQCSGILWKGQPKTENSKLWLLTYKYTVNFSFPNKGRLNRIPSRRNLDSVRPLPVPTRVITKLSILALNTKIILCNLASIQ